MTRFVPGFDVLLGRAAPHRPKSVTSSPSTFRHLAGITAGLFRRHSRPGASQPRSSNAERSPPGDVSTKAIGAERIMSDGNASPSSAAGALEFVEHAARQQAAHYREQAAHFRSLAEMEPLASLRRHLMGLVRQYEELAASAEVQARE